MSCIDDSISGMFDLHGQKMIKKKILSKLRYGDFLGFYQNRKIA